MAPYDPALPFFSYGIFKPGELAYRQLLPYVESSRRAVIQGRLWVRDGLPLLALTPGDEVRGYLLIFQPGQEQEAYDLINQTEPQEHYRWYKITLLEPPAEANVLLARGRDPAEKGAVPCEEPEWSARHDPVFTHGLAVVRQAIAELAQEPFDSTPPDSFDWPRFFRLQMAYLLLWAAIERYAAFAYGPKRDPTEKVENLGADPLFRAALRCTVARRDAVVRDSRDPNRSYRLDPDRPDSSSKYYYQIRSNMSHQSKSAWRDGELVRQALWELYKIFTTMLEEHWHANAAT